MLLRICNLSAAHDLPSEKSKKNVDITIISDKQTKKEHQTGVPFVVYFDCFTKS